MFQDQAAGTVGGAVTRTGSSKTTKAGTGNNYNGFVFNFDASRVVATAAETRPINTALYACIGAY